MIWSESGHGSPELGKDQLWFNQSSEVCCDELMGSLHVEQSDPSPTALVLTLFLLSGKKGTDSLF